MAGEGIRFLSTNLSGLTVNVTYTPDDGSSGSIWVHLQCHLIT